jgi:hypothetical protein
MSTLFSNGKFAVVDLFYRHVWVNTDDEDIAHQVRKVFWAKASCAVFDLSWFDDYTENLIDSEVSLFWKIESDHLLSPLTSIHVSYSFDNVATNYTYSSKKLINQPNSSTLSPGRQIELQQQMLLYMEILKVTHLHCKSHHENITLSKDFFFEINKIFQTELELDTIKAMLLNLAVDKLDTLVTDSACILRLLDKQYE